MLTLYPWAHSAVCRRLYFWDCINMGKQKREGKED